MDLLEHHIDTMEYLHSIYMNANRTDISYEEALRLIRKSAARAIEEDDQYNEENYAA